MLYSALVVTLWTCYGALQIVVLLLLLLKTLVVDWKILVIGGLYFDISQ